MLMLGMRRGVRRGRSDDAGWEEGFCLVYGSVRLWGLFFLLGFVLYHFHLVLFSWLCYGRRTAFCAKGEPKSISD